MNEKPVKVEKADDNTLRLILTRTENVTMVNLLANKKQLEDKIADMQKVLNNVNEMFSEATKLGIVPLKQPSCLGKPTVIRAGVDPKEKKK